MTLFHTKLLTSSLSFGLQHHWMAFGRHGTVLQRRYDLSGRTAIVHFQIGQTIVQFGTVDQHLVVESVLLPSQQHHKVVVPKLFEAVQLTVQEYDERLLVTGIIRYRRCSQDQFL